ncbi:helix-turn-helix domain-containing protein [Nonomuraea antimicrobica]
MIRAAMELFAERGFDETTAGDIAERAGVTERTFFRHFADKREVLFDGSKTMERTAHDAILAAPADHSPLDAALAGVVAGAGPLEDRRDHAVRRSAIVAANPSLRERELLKLAALAGAMTEALRARGSPNSTPASPRTAQWRSSRSRSCAGSRRTSRRPSPPASRRPRRHCAP